MKGIFVHIVPCCHILLAARYGEFPDIPFRLSQGYIYRIKLFVLDMHDTTYIL